MATDLAEFVGARSRSTIAMGLAGVANAAMLIVSASLFHERGFTGVGSIEQAHAGFGDLVGPAAALAFALALLASGLDHRLTPRGERVMGPDPLPDRRASSAGAGIPPSSVRTCVRRY